MHVSPRRALTVLAVVVFATGAMANDRPDRPADKTATRTAPGAARPIGPTTTSATVITRATAILGSAWTAEYAPIRQASLRLRNVVTGKVEAVTVGNDAGQFAFTNVPGGSYVVELLGATGHVVVVGHVFTIAPGETVATFVRTGTKVPWLTDFFRNTVSAVTSTAASEGVTAIAPIARAVSPNQ
jgi:hypothetical protein